MLGPRYNKQYFSMRKGNGPWRPTYSGPEFRREAQGRCGCFQSVWIGARGGLLHEPEQRGFCLGQIYFPLQPTGIFPDLADICLAHVGGGDWLIDGILPDTVIEIEDGELRSDPRTPGPIYFSEDDNGRETTDKNWQLELGSLTAIWNGGGSWGYMPWVQLQIWPFRMYDPAGVDGRDAAYFRTILERISLLVHRKPASPGQQ